MSASPTPVPVPVPVQPETMPSGHGARRNGFILLALVVLIGAAIVLLPGLDHLRDELGKASPAWIALASVLELLSCLSYVAAFRGVFCREMTWRTAYDIGMAEQAANAVIPAGGAGGLALGAWALRRTGMSGGRIARRSVAFFLLTSLPNLAILATMGIVLLFDGSFDLALTLIPAVVGIVVIAAVALLPLVLKPLVRRAGRRNSRITGVLESLSDGVLEARALLRGRDPWLWIGILGYLAFDVATLWAAYRAFGASPDLGPLTLGYIIGQLGGLIPLPGGIGGLDGGLVGALVLYGIAATTTAAAVIVYRGVMLWVPLALGSFAFVSLRSRLAADPFGAVPCAFDGPLPTEVVPSP